MSMAKILIANQDEIAVRSIRAATDLDIKTFYVRRVSLKIFILGKRIIYDKTRGWAISRFTRAVKELKPAELKTIPPIFPSLLGYVDLKEGALLNK